MIDGRSEILARIRRAREESACRPKPYDAIERRYEQQAALEQDQILDLFEDRLHDYGATVFRCSTRELPQTIAEAAALRKQTNLLIPFGFPPEWLPDSVKFTNDEQLSYAEIDRIGGVLTTCALAIAETGTIIVRHDRHAGRRALSLIPDYHLCVVETNQVVASVVEGIRRCGGFGTMPLTTISGPSATADIEMTRIKGVHGPRTLDVILLEVDHS